MGKMPAPGDLTSVALAVAPPSYLMLAFPLPPVESPLQRRPIQYGNYRVHGAPCAFVHPIGCFD